MRKRIIAICVAVFCAVLVGCSHLASANGAQSPSGVAIRTETYTNPPLHLFIAEVDLKNPHVHVRVAPGGADPDGVGPWETILTRPTEIAAREHFYLVVNGDFFATRRIKNPDGSAKTLPDPLRWGAALGPAETDGRVWSTTKTNRPCLVVRKDGSVAIRTMKRPPADAWEVVAGNVMLVRNGAVVYHSQTNLNPRTCVGLNADKSKMILLVADGRKPGVSMGLTYNQLAATMIRLGCSDAINLDGGGSTIMAVRNSAAGGYRILNVPSDGHERPVADVVGISLDFPGRVAGLNQ